MDLYEDKEWSGCDLNLDPWEPYRGKYPEPTHEESRLIHKFLSKFELEDDNFDEDGNSRWIYFKEHLQIPNLRSHLIKFLTQVRQSKGYEVDLYLDFSVVPSWSWYNVFVPRGLDEQNFYDEAMAATKFAIGEIKRLCGKNYEVASVDKLVTTTTNLLLLSFTVKEIDTADFKAFQAMVVYDAGATTPFRLKEWKFRPNPIHKL